jgi:hypothetical protein
MNRRARLALLLLPAAALLVAGCQGSGNTKAGGASPAADRAAQDPRQDPRAQPHLQLFARVEGLLRRWDDLRNEALLSDAEALEPQLRQEVDGHFDVFTQAATGTMGPQAQYLAVSALGFSARPEATRVLLARLGQTDARLQGNALIALSVRADPATPRDVLVERIAPSMPVALKRYAPLALANVLEARTRAGMPAEPALEHRALSHLGAVASDQDPATRLHVVKALRALRIPGTFAYLAPLVDDPEMRVRWAAASALADLGDPRGFSAVIRLLNDVPEESKHIVRDVLVSYAGRMRKRPLTADEIASLGTGPRAWSQWFDAWRRAQGMVPPRAVPQPVGGTTPSRR